jgi:hypothetical protein
VIEEITGVRADLRNLLHVPREQHKRFAGSSGLDLAVALRGLQAVNASTLSQHAFPCCARGAECCPIGRRGHTRSCCSHGAVHKWLNRVVQHGGADLQWSTRTTWYDQHRHIFQRARDLLHYQEEERRRPLEAVGFSFNTPAGPHRPRPTFSATMTADERQRALTRLREWKRLRDSDARESRDHDQ